MNQVDIIVGQFHMDLFENEEIRINLNVADATEISKTFTDFSQSFTIPASRLNNQVMAFYYRTDLTDYIIAQPESTPWQSITDLWNALSTTTWDSSWERMVYLQSFWNYQYRRPGYIEINGNRFRAGTYSLDSVEMRNGEPYSYTMTFYGSITRLSDIFGELYLSDLYFLSDYDHQYIPSDVLLLTNNTANRPDILYPLISPVRPWTWNEHGGGGADENDIKYHVGGGHSHGINWYELKPALRVAKIIQGIQDQFGVTFTGSLFSSNPFTGLYLWLHRKAGYMYEGQPSASPSVRLIADSPYSPIPEDWWDYSLNQFTAQGLIGSGEVYDFDINISTTYAFDYNIKVIINGIERANYLKVGGGNFNGVIISGLSVMTNDIGWVEIQTSTNVAATFNLTELRMHLTFNPLVIYVSATSGVVTQAIGEMVTKDNMPEMKIKDFFTGLLKMHNAVCLQENPLNDLEFRVDILDIWYNSGQLQPLQNYFETSSYTFRRPTLYKTIKFAYKEPTAILNYEFAQRNRVAYGDLQADFVFDNETYEVSLPFEQMLFSRLTDATTGALTNVNVGYAFDREIQPNLGGPFLFYVFNRSLTPTANYGFIDNVGGNTSCGKYYVANTSIEAVPGPNNFSTNFGADIDAYHLQAVSRSLYQNYYYNTITNLYDTRCRILNIKAQLPLFELLRLKLNNTLQFRESLWRINKVEVNLTTGEADFELINLQYNSFMQLPSTIEPGPEPPSEE